VHVRRVAYGPRQDMLPESEDRRGSWPMFRCPENTIVRARLTFEVSPSRGVMQLGHAAQSLGLAGAQGTVVV
jgi:hypothetical protein